VAHDLHRRGRVVRASNGLTTTPSGTCGSWREARTWRLAPSVLGLFVAQCSSVTCCRSCFSVSIKGQHTGELSPGRSSPVFLCLLFIFFLGLLARVRAMVNLTGGNRFGLTGYRSNRSGPVPVSAGTQPAKIQILNLNSKNEKFPKNS